MSDTIAVTGISATGFHGVFEVEKESGQTFVVDVTLDADLTAAGQSDDLADTVNYAEVAALVVARIEGPSFDLIERLADAIAADVLSAEISSLRVDAVTVAVHKPQAPVGVTFGDVVVTVRRERPAVPVVIALGTNLGDRYATLAFAENALVERIMSGQLVVSDYVETDPVGGPEQPDYLNAVAVGFTRLSPATVLGELHRIEQSAGRTREIRWGARTLDLDLIQYGDPTTGSDITSVSDRLTLPHPRAHERGFVLVPWLDADPDATLRVEDEVRDVRDLVETVDVSGVREAVPAAGHADCCGPGGCG